MLKERSMVEFKVQKITWDQAVIDLSKKVNSVAQFEQLFYGVRRWKTVVVFTPVSNFSHSQFLWLVFVKSSQQGTTQLNYLDSL